jgi:hypothetical protein
MGSQASTTHRFRQQQQQQKQQHQHGGGSSRSRISLSTGMIPPRGVATTSKIHQRWTQSDLQMEDKEDEKS